MPKIKNIVETHEDDELDVDNYSEYRGVQDDNKISADLVANFFLFQGRKMMKEVFTEVYDDLLSKIEKDYGIPLNELREKYPIDVKVHRRKPRDPLNACTALTKKGTECINNRKEPHDVCGIHLISKKDTNIVGNSYETRGKSTTSTKSISKEAGNYLPKEDPKEKLGPSYLPKDGNISATEDTDNEAEAEVEVNEINGIKYLVWDKKIFHMPDNVEEELSLDDLNIAGTRLENGTIEWVK